MTPTTDLTVSYATTNGTAIAGSDYTSASGTLTFTSAAAGSQTVDVQTTEDTLDESDETYVFAITSPSGGGGPSPSLGSGSSKTTTITDDDGTPNSITLSVNPSSVGEDDEATEITVTATLNGGSTLSTDTTVTITLGGDATENTDYTATTLASVTISANSSSGTETLTVTPTDDDVVEGEETITVSGSAADFTVHSADITLTDDERGNTDNLDAALLSISGPSVSVSEGGNAVFTVTLSKAVSKEVSVAWSATAGTAGSGDYSPDSGTATFPANSAAGSTQTISVAVTNDDLSETAETFSVTLGAVGGDLSSQVSVDASAASAEATIAASDRITVSISGPSSVDEGDAVTYTVSLSGGSPSANLTVSYRTTNGTAIAGIDYTSATGTVTFTQAAPGSRTFTVQTTGDTLFESNETFTVTISNARDGGGSTPGLGTSSVTTTITDDDAPVFTDPPVPPEPPDPPDPVVTPKPVSTPTPGPGNTPTPEPGDTPTPEPRDTPTPGPGDTPTPDAKRDAYTQTWVYIHLGQCRRLRLSRGTRLHPGRGMGPDTRLGLDPEQDRERGRDSRRGWRAYAYPYTHSDSDYRARTRIGSVAGSNAVGRAHPYAGDGWRLLTAHNQIDWRKRFDFNGFSNVVVDPVVVGFTAALVDHAVASVADSNCDEDYEKTYETCMAARGGLPAHGEPALTGAGYSGRLLTREPGH